MPTVLTGGTGADPRLVVPESTHWWHIQVDVLVRWFQHPPDADAAIGISGISDQGSDQGSDIPQRKRRGPGRGPSQRLNSTRFSTQATEELQVCQCVTEAHVKPASGSLPTDASARPVAVTRQLGHT